MEMKESIFLIADYGGICSMLSHAEGLALFCSLTAGFNELSFQMSKKVLIFSRIVSLDGTDTRGGCSAEGAQNWQYAALRDRHGHSDARPSICHRVPNFESGHAYP